MREPLRFYSLNPEHACSEVEFEIQDSRNIEIYGLKTEGCEEILKFNTFGTSVGALVRITGSRDVFITAVGNNGKVPKAGRGLFEIERCQNIAVTTVSVLPRGKGDYPILIDNTETHGSAIPASANVGLFRWGDPARARE